MATGSNFSTFLNENIRSGAEKMERTNKMADFKKYLDDPNNLLGKGTFGKVFKVKDDGEWCALK